MKRPTSWLKRLGLFNTGKHNKVLRESTLIQQPQWLFAAVFLTVITIIPWTAASNITYRSRATVRDARSRNSYYPALAEAVEEPLEAYATNPQHTRLPEFDATEIYQMLNFQVSEK